MLWNELLRKGNISLLQSKSDSQYCVCSNYDETQEEDKQYCNGKYFCYWGDTERKSYFLSAALDYFRCRTEENYIPYSRMEELATDFAHEMAYAEPNETAYYLTMEEDLEEHELDYLGFDKNGYEKKEDL